MSFLNKELVPFGTSGTFAAQDNGFINDLRLGTVLAFVNHFDPCQEFNLEDISFENWQYYHSLDYSFMALDENLKFKHKKILTENTLNGFDAGFIANMEFMQRLRNNLVNDEDSVRRKFLNTVLKSNHSYIKENDLLSLDGLLVYDSLIAL